MKVRPATPDDAADIAAIYAPYVGGTAISFETKAPDAAEMARRMAAADDLYPWLVACDEEGVQGYAYACAFRERPAYRFSVETSVYVTDGSVRRGVGTSLYAALFPVLEAQGFTQAIAAITLPSPSSVPLHERFGFRRVGTYEEVGFKLGEWRSVGLWQRALAPLSNPPEEPKRLSAIAADWPPPAQ